MKTYYRVWRLQGEEQAKRMHADPLSLPMIRIDLDDRIPLRAGAIKANYTLSVADAWIIATAIEVDASLVHKDPEFEQTRDIAL